MKEAQHTEWKESWRDEYLHWISGFANAEGGVPVPKLREEKPGLWVEFGFRAPVETPVKTPVETPVEPSARTPEKILTYLQTNPAASLADTAAAIGKSLRAVERASTKLVQEGRLRFVGPRKSGHWKVPK